MTGDRRADPSRVLANLVNAPGPNPWVDESTTKYVRHVMQSAVHALCAEFNRVLDARDALAAETREKT